MDGQYTSINKVLEFIGNETRIISKDIELISPPPFLVLLGDKNRVSKSTAFATPAFLVDTIWKVVK